VTSFVVIFFFAWHGDSYLYRFRCERLQFSLPEPDRTFVRDQIMFTDLHGAVFPTDIFDDIPF